MAFKMTKPTFGKSPVEMQSPFKSDKQEDIANKQPVVSSESPGPNWVKEKGTNQWSYVEPPVVEEPVEDGKFLRERSEFIPPEKTTFPPEEERTTGYPAERGATVSDVLPDVPDKGVPGGRDPSLVTDKFEDEIVDIDEDEPLIWGLDEDGNAVTDLDKWKAMGGN